MTATGVEFYDDASGIEQCSLNVAPRVRLEGPTHEVVAWLHDAGLEVLALAVADSHFDRIADQCGSPLAQTWVGGGTDAPMA